MADVVEDEEDGCCGLLEGSTVAGFDAILAGFDDVVDAAVPLSAFFPAFPNKLLFCAERDIVLFRDAVSWVKVRSSWQLNGPGQG